MKLMGFSYHILKLNKNPNYFLNVNHYGQTILKINDFADAR